MKPDDIIRATTEHYQRLARDDTGHSRDFDYWKNEQHFWHSGSKPSTQVLEQLNAPVTYGEVMATIQRMALGKAPGPSGVTAEFLRAAVQFEEAEGRARSYRNRR